jgi:hypothetical protein
MLRLIGSLELDSSQLERNATQDMLPKGVLSSSNEQCGQMIEATYIFLEIMTTCEDCSLFSNCPWNCPWAAISLGLLGNGGAMGVNRDVKVSF